MGKSNLHARFIQAQATKKGVNEKFMFQIQFGKSTCVLKLRRETVVNNQINSGSNENGHKNADLWLNTPKFR